MLRLAKEVLVELRQDKDKVHHEKQPLSLRLRSLIKLLGMDPRLDGVDHVSRDALSRSEAVGRVEDRHQLALHVLLLQHLDG